MKYVIVLIGSLCCATASDNRIGSAHIVNDTDHTLNAEIGISTRGQADVTITNIDAQEALRKAILQDSAQDVRNAVHVGADVNQKIQNKTPLMWAVLLDRIQVAPELLQLGAVVDTECVRAAVKLCRAIAPVLVKHWSTTAHVLGDSERLKAARGFVGNARNPVLALECVKALLKEGDVLDRCDWNEIISRNVECANDKASVLALIKEAAVHVADIGDLWGVALYLGRWDSHSCEEAVKFLLARGANPNRAFEGECTPLYLAVCECFNTNIARLLLAAGADVNKTCQRSSCSCDNRSILSSVIYGGGDDLKKREIATLLLEYGAEL
jgi:ankyrin repeat protein